MLIRVLTFNSLISKVPSHGMAKRIKVDKNTIKDIATADSLCNSVTLANTVNMNQVRSTSVGFTFTKLPSPLKSESDLKEYSVIQLDNGLTALLISDKSQIINLDVFEKSVDNDSSGSDSDTSETETVTSSEEEDDDCKEEEEVQKKNSGCEEKLAACSLCIGVGSFSDPENIPGLAHFLEHMIFMGSEKYPKENEFDVYIKKKGGSDNASTECEYTTFYFDCHEAYLYGGLDIFAQLFVNPLMKRESMTKEREAVESEFKMSLSSDESRKSQLLCSLANKSNPAHKFLWGNLITLRDNVSDDELYNAVHEFRKLHYSAHRMTLAVQARLPLETLQNWVVECFQDIPNNGLFPDPCIMLDPPFIQEEFFKLFIIEPVKNINHLDLTWVMPSTLKMYKTKPLDYISWVIGHEGKGSLISYLRQQFWSFNITVSGGGDGTEENSLYTLFTISLILTEEGVQHIEEILNLVFAYIKMFQDIGPQERLFNEIQLIANMSFRFSEEVLSSENVEQLSENMHFYPPADYITGAELYFEYDSQVIKLFLNELKACNVNIMISSKVVAATENLDKTEQWFGTKYHSKAIPTEWKEKWENSIENKQFHIPESNPFITSDFTILPILSKTEEFPQKIVNDDMLELWYKQDITFKLPHAFCYLHLITPESCISAENAAMTDLFLSILRQSLAEELYPANVAQLQYAFHFGEKGIIITLNGFNEKLKVLLLAIIKGMVSMTENLKSVMFFTMKDELKRNYYNANLKPSVLGREIRMSILLETYWSVLEKKKALKSITLELFKDYILQYFKHLYVQLLIQGNISKDEALEFGELVKKEISFQPLVVNTMPNIRVKQLPFGEKYCVVQSFNYDDVNSVVTNYYQSGLGTIKESCIIELLLMMMEEPMFDSLRTKQQLGYDVSCSLRDTFGILGFSVSVHCQSDRNSVDLVENRITEFLNEFLRSLKKTSIEDFKEIQESLVKLKKCADIHLKEEVKRNWDEIKSEDYVFDRHHKEKEWIEKLTLEDVVKWFEITAGVSEKSKFKKLSVQVVGKVDKSDCKSSVQINRDIYEQELCFVKKQETSDTFVIGLKEFNATLYLYPVHKIV